MTATMKPAFHGDDHAVYFTDNGAMLCGAHLGSSARYTGRDLSGQPIKRVTVQDAVDLAAMGCEAKCEHCGKVSA